VELRQYLSKQPGPSSTDPISLPPALLSLLIPHLNNAASQNTGSNTVTTALTQRAHLLQEENNELYELLKQSETGKLKDELRGLRRAVAKLESALTGVCCYLESRISYAEKVSRPF
jgi:WTAP/Mum2p family